MGRSMPGIGESVLQVKSAALLTAEPIPLANLPRIKNCERDPLAPVPNTSHRLPTDLNTPSEWIECSVSDPQLICRSIRLKTPFTRNHYMRHRQRVGLGSSAVEEMSFNNT